MREYFNNYVAIDPGFGFANESYLKQVLDTLRTADLSSENLYFAAANTLPTFLELEDLLSDSSDVMKLIDIPNRKFLNLDYAEEWQLNIISKHYPEENHFSVPLQATKDAFKFFYKFYSFREIMDYYHPDYSEKKDLISKIEDHYKMISELMDCKTIPMMGYINSFAFGIDASGRTDLAIELFEYNISLHPNSPIVYNNLGYYHMNKGYKIKAIEQFEKSLILKKDDNILSIRDRLNKEILEKK